VQLVVNQLLEEKSDASKLERIVWLDYEHGICFLVNINNPTFPYQLEIDEILHKLDVGELNITQKDPWLNAVADEELREVEKQKRDFAWEVVQSIYQIPDIFVPKRRGELVKDASKKFDVSTKTIRQILKRYWVRGMAKNSLLPDFKNCGKQQSGEKLYKRKVGRPAVYETSIQRATVSKEWKQIFHRSLDKHYFIKTKPSLKHAYQQMIKEYFTRKDKESGLKVLDLSKPIPTYDQFYYFFRKQYKGDYAIYKREGRREYLQNHRAITGSATEDAMGIGLYAVDGTIADIYLTSSITKGEIIGRPIIYIVVDIFSRSIVGINVSIENMSGESLRVALANTFENKKDWCKRTLDMVIRDEDWPIHYIPHTLLADRGSELISNNLTSIVENLNIKIQNTGSYRPELKGVCENYFGIIQQHLSPFLPGSLKKDFNKRGSQDYRKLATLNLTEYTRILVHCILFYNSRYIKDYPLTQGMIDDKVPPIPLEIFKWGLCKGTGQLKTMTLDQIRSNVYPVTQATVSAKGILLNGLCYSCATAIQERWFSTARQKGTWRIDVLYNPQNMAQIYIRHDRNNFETCSLIDQFDMYRSARMQEVIDYKGRKRQQEADYHENELNNQIKLAQEIEEIVKNAKKIAKTEFKNGRSFKNVKVIRENRKMEQKLMKDANIIEQPVAKEESLISDVSSSNQVKNIQLFRQKQKEGLNHEDH
jgi:transposase InsO family protein